MGGAELVHHLRCLRLLARIGTGDEHRPFAGGAGDKPELLGIQRVAGDQLKILASVVRLPDD